ncbi:MAG TPA: hypothetical protein VFT64_04030 [Rickettsiales bacterium]|nr:hypothetical protein [Rickettsiales bacterium]
MRDFIDWIIASIHTFLYGSSTSLGLLSNVSYNKILFWIFIVFVIRMITLSVFERRPGIRILANLGAAIIFFAIAAPMRFQKEMRLVSEAALFLTSFNALYIFLLWLPIRIQYNPKADEEINEILAHGELSVEDNERIYKLRKRSREAYENNVKWLFKPGRVKKEKF